MARADWRDRSSGCTAVMWYPRNVAYRFCKEPNIPLFAYQTFVEPLWFHIKRYRKSSRWLFFYLSDVRFRVSTLCRRGSKVYFPDNSTSSICGMWQQDSGLNRITVSSLNLSWKSSLRWFSVSIEVPVTLHAHTAITVTRMSPRWPASTENIFRRFAQRS